MDLEALLGELRGNVLRDDAELASGPNDSLWDDDTLVRYINDAQQQFARRTLSLRDASTQAVVEVSLQAGVASYALHKSVIAVVSARYDTTTTDLARVGRALIMTRVQADPPWLDPDAVSSLPPGPSLAYSTDETLDVDVKGAVTLTVYPTPATAQANKIIYLRTARLPLKVFTVDDLAMKCEIEEGYQLDMLEWAAYRAMNNSDIDGHKAEAKDHRDAFDACVRRVLKDVKRKMRSPIRFQFGANGFRW